MKLYDSPFSPFVRNVWMALGHEGLAFEAVDALLAENGSSPPATVAARS